jgi:D-tyrosyl-tRNA(Tyr) deacylase
LTDIKRDLLLVAQFTLTADTRNSLRPRLNNAAPPEIGKQLFHDMCKDAEHQYHNVEIGQYGVNMQVSLINDGPSTTWLQDSRKTSVTKIHYSH